MKPKSSSGFTLIELMIVVAIVGIIVAIAIPSYQSHITSTRRGMATSCLSEAAQQMERRFTASLSYGTTTTFPNLACATDLSSIYVLSFTSTPTNSTYALEADPQGQQANDSCGKLTLNHQGVKGAAGSTVKSCWK